MQLRVLGNWGAMVSCKKKPELGLIDHLWERRGIHRASKSREKSGVIHTRDVSLISGI